MENLDKTSARPLYLQLEDILRSKIKEGVWKENQKIPSENELANTYEISRVTARSVLTKLVNEGLLYRAQGKGTFVAQQKFMTHSFVWGGLSAQLENLYVSTETKIVDFELVAAGEYIARKMKSNEDTMMRFISCVCYADGIPVSFHKTYIPYGMCPTLEKDVLQNGRLYETLKNQYHLSPEVVQETLEMVSVTEEEGELLELKENDKAFFVEASSTDRKGFIYRFDKVIFRGDKIKIQFNFNADGSFFKAMDNDK